MEATQATKEGIDLMKSIRLYIQTERKNIETLNKNLYDRECNLRGLEQILNDFSTQTLPIAFEISLKTSGQIAFFFDGSILGFALDEFGVTFRSVNRQICDYKQPGKSLVRRIIHKFLAREFVTELIFEKNVIATYVEAPSYSTKQNYAKKLQEDLINSFEEFGFRTPTFTY